MTQRNHNHSVCSQLKKENCDINASQKIKNVFYSVMCNKVKLGKRMKWENIT